MLSEHQTMAVRALEELQAICDKHNLKLYLLAGTALGAVRGQGMIPWDDDIDVGLLYDDWYKLRSILADELSDNFEYVDYDIDPNFPRFYGKILYQRKNCVDIFLIAKWTEQKLPAKYYWHVRKIIYDFYRYRLHYKIPMRPNKSPLQVFRFKLVRWIRKAEYGLTRPFMKKSDYVRIIKKTERAFENDAYDCYINLYSCYRMEKETIRREWIEKTSTVMFEWKEYTTVGDPDAYLTHLYGDYMTPPPEDKRKAAHDEIF